MTLFEQIEASAAIDDLDEAVRPLQELLGQKDGGVAGNFFSGAYEASWPTATKAMRLIMLRLYLDTEVGMHING